MHIDRFRSLATAFFALMLLGPAAGAHDLPVNSIMNAFVKVQPRQIDLVVRVPMGLLRGLPFPRVDSSYDVGASGPAMQLALLFLEDGFVLSEDLSLIHI